MKRKGFTLIELLAVVVILAVIVAVAIPFIGNIVEGARRKSFKINTEMVLSTLDRKLLDDENFDVTSINEKNLDLIDLSADNYNSVTVEIIDEKVYITIVGAGKWKGLTSFGTLDNIIVDFSSENDKIEPIITLSGEYKINVNRGDIYVDPGATAVDDVDGDITDNLVYNSTVDTNNLGIYYVTYDVSDAAGNKAKTVIRIVEVVQAFSYTGGVQTFTAPVTGTYKLETWGAEGGTETSSTLPGGKGGYTSGDVNLTVGETLYVVVGGKGTDSYSGTIKVFSGGYNGGGNGYVSRTTNGSSGSGGGGATHIATTNLGILSNYSSSISDLLLVAGGGGGTYVDTDGGGWDSIGGAGGGDKGLYITQTDTCSSSCTLYSAPTGGTQTSGGLGVTDWSTGATSTTSYVGTFGRGGTGKNSYGGGGGGFYGGASGEYNGGGGGSSYIGSVNNGVTINGISSMTSPTGAVHLGNEGNGYAKISLVVSNPKIVINGEESVFVPLGDSYTDLGATATDLTDGDLTTSIVYYENVDINTSGDYYVIYVVTNSLGKTNFAIRKVVVGEVLKEFAYTGAVQTFTAPVTGTYKLETWGAEGGTATSSATPGGKGGYASGEVNLNFGDNLYIFVGGKGTNSYSGTVMKFNGGYNGGGNGYVSRTINGSSGAGGGGATHITTNNLGTLFNYSSKMSYLLLVAGGGGGTYADTDGGGWDSIGGSGGGDTGLSITQTGTCDSSCTLYSAPTGGTQTSGGLGVTDWATGATSITSYVGTFGRGGTGKNSYGGGGGGFYGGASGEYNGGGGGSSYIGSINNGVTINGDNSMPNILEGNETGHVGNGYAKISLLY